MGNMIVMTPNEEALIQGTQVPEQELESFREWYPITIAGDSCSPDVWWRFAGKERFTAPFFEDTLRRLKHDGRPCCRASVESLSECDRLDSVAPTAVVFHASRCGSTLLTQLLAALPQCIVVPEPFVIDPVLRVHASNHTPAWADRALTQVIRALGQRRFEAEQHFFLKLDSWDIGSLPLFQEAFPDTPCLYLYRRPEEILASHRRERGPQMVPGLVDPSLLDLGPEPIDPADLDGYCLKVLASFFRYAIRHSQSAGLILVDYDQLPQLIWSHLLDHFSISCTPAQIATMQARSKHHAKRPKEPFVGDSPVEIGAVDDAIWEPVCSLYDELERLRLAQGWFLS